MLNALYPEDWPALVREIKDAVDYRCQACGRQCRRPGEFWLGWQYTLTVAHICQDYNAEAVTVCCLCLPCHLAYDAPHSWIARRRRARWRQARAGQLEFLTA